MILLKSTYNYLSTSIEAASTETNGKKHDVPRIIAKKSFVQIGSADASIFFFFAFITTTSTITKSASTDVGRPLQLNYDVA